MPCKMFEWDLLRACHTSTTPQPPSPMFIHLWQIYPPPLYQSVSLLIRKAHLVLFISTVQKEERHYRILFALFKHRFFKQH